MAIRIITDSPSDISINEAKELNLGIVPLKITFDEKSYVEGVDISVEEFYKKLDTSENLPTTSTPSPEDYLTHFNQAKEAGDDVIVITLSAGISGTYQCANLAKDMADYSKIHIIDSGQATISQMLLVRYALSLRDAGKNCDEIVEEIERAKERVVLLVMVDTLDNLHKGGRLSKSVTLAGNMLKIKPILTLKDGKVGIEGKARGFKGSIKTILKLIDEYGEIDSSSPVYFGYAGNSDHCSIFKEKSR